MDKNSSLSTVREIMEEFTGSTGLEPAQESPRRYLWTDAFAVCNFLELWNKTGEGKYRDLALKLVDQVHHVLGRHRKDDSRRGWISGLPEDDGSRHPTKGGLRIGKGMPERRPDEPFDEQLEWDRDGQYFHYLTKWMHALNRTTGTTGDFIFNRWAMELAKAAYSAFVFAPPYGGPKRMVWKMSIDLSYPLVPSMGHHDPLDGLITFSQLQATSKKDNGKPKELNLESEIADLTAICSGKTWATDDPLGLGGLLSDAFRMAQLMSRGDFDQNSLLLTLLDASLDGLSAFNRRNPLRHPADYRLAFRELGFSIGLHAVEELKKCFEQQKGLYQMPEGVETRIDDLRLYIPLGKTIETFWLEDKNRQQDTWVEHQDINMVMLATSLAPDAFLTIS